LKILKQIVADIKTSVVEPGANRDALIRKFVLYSPKMPLRLHQEQLIAEAKKFNLSVYDETLRQATLRLTVLAGAMARLKYCLLTVGLLKHSISTS